MTRLLLVEDERKIASFVTKGLTEAGYIVDVERDGEAGLKTATSGAYDLVILDWMLPLMDGLEVCRRIRNSAPQMPVLFLTAKEAVLDKVAGLDAGADDYLTKPFSFLELLARIRTLLRRGSRVLEELEVGNLIMNVTERTVSRGDRVIELSNKEFTILEDPLRNKNRLVTRAALTEHVWHIDFDRGTNLIDVYINYLRKKLDEDKERPIIKTVRGAGYIITES